MITIIIYKKSIIIIKQKKEAYLREFKVFQYLAILVNILCNLVNEIDWANLTVRQVPAQLRYFFG